MIVSSRVYSSIYADAGPTQQHESTAYAIGSPLRWQWNIWRQQHNRRSIV